MNKSYYKFLLFRYFFYYFSFLFLCSFSSCLAGERSGNIYGLPPCITEQGLKIDSIFSIIFYLTLVVFIVVQGTYIFYLIVFRKKENTPAFYTKGNNLFEFIWTALPTIIFLIIAFYSNHLWDQIHSPAPKDSLIIDVSSYQFGWEMRYAGISGTLSPSDVQKISPSNRFGTDINDPRTAQDIISNELVLPVGKPVHLYLHSRDVIHAFYVPEFRLYQDCVPGRTIEWVWFKITKIGNFQLSCNQLCGIGHYNMKAPIRVVTQSEFTEWIKKKREKVLQMTALKNQSHS